MNRLAALVILGALAAPAWPQNATTQSAPRVQKRRVAVLDFEYGTVSGSVAQVMGGRFDIGKGIADMVVNRLVNGGKYSVFERKDADKIVAEQNMANSNRFDSAGAAKIGKMLGVEAIILGSITQFGRDDQVNNVGANAGRLGRYGVGGVGRRNSRAIVGISARMIDVNTGEVLLVAQGQGRANRTGVTMEGGGSGPASAAGGVLDMRAANFAQTVIGEAVHRAVTDLVGRLEANADRIPEVEVEVNAVVADVAGATIIINAGKRTGVKVGDKLKVRRTAREVKDPVSGEVLRRVEESLGEITITEVDDKSAVGTYTGQGAPKVGDTVRNK